MTGKGKYTVKVVDQPPITLVEILNNKGWKIIYIHNKKLRDTQKDVRYDIKNIKRDGGVKNVEWV